ncbi:hypothetical protein [Thermoplasma volcanium GSS1]|uniref:NFACT RNA-binding domain-containing protein n=1 Tax=Thermoplasma volcanium (strain ATCC 51530 / DSM 4299 / JCM 9571 / NBRC 15438 / GSS1) TaxID=273116 RepID=Q978F4_THEVO|nr:ribosome rescue protein RqcH [Thermoplasma volcanium]BAB60605.1 hypothetical protein [Thermoplasma volcanium GSS1]
MKDKESSLDFYAFTGIYRERLVGSFVKKVYQTGPDDFLIQLYRSDLKRFDMLVSLKKGIFFKSEETPDTASQTAMVLRKTISDRRIVSVEQVNFDRVVKFVFHTGQALILELFRDGNLIATDGDKITFVLKPRRWRNRDLEVGAIYIPPSSSDPTKMTDEEFVNTVRQSKANAVQTLATRFNLGGDLAEEVLFRIGLPKDGAVDDLENRANDVRRSLAEILQESLLNSAYYYEDQGTVSPVPMKHFGEYTRKFDDFNEGLVFLLSMSPQEEESEDPIQRRINSQMKSIEEFGKIAEKYRSYGSQIMQNLQTVEMAIKDARSGNYPSDKMNKATKHISLKLGEEDIDIDYTKSAGENANRYFDLSKDYRKKIEGAKKAIEEAEQERIKLQEKKVKSVNRRIFWFETYHWFISSEGYLVIAGRDAKSNEKIVKKHLKEGDLYVHADMYGAPSTIIKSEGKPMPGEDTIRQAAAFAICFSRAWPAGIASGTAYWVYPSQVSKTPESGEYVSTGSWIIRGKRNYVTNLKLELCIGLREIEGVSLPMIGPPEVFGENEKCIHIIPGDVRRSEIAKQIAEYLNVSKEEVEKILPPGNSRIVPLKPVQNAS